jgi:dihydrofolate reductase
MRKVTFGVANSLDNFIARTDHAVDWLLWCDEAMEFMKEFWPTIDTVVMGRKTYDVAAKSGTPSYPGVMTYVFSRTLAPSSLDGVEIVAAEVTDFVRELKTQSGKGICVMGGGELAKPLLEADLIDEIGLNIHPVLLGAGIPLFLSMNVQIDLDLIECKPFKNGCILARYVVKHHAGCSDTSQVAR